MYSNWRFWGIFLIAFLWGNFINFVNNVYKVMGSVYIKNDAILSLAGSIGIALGIVGKLGWPVLSKYLSFKVTA